MAKKTVHERDIIGWMHDMLSRGFTIEIDEHETISATFPMESRWMAPFTLADLKRLA